MTVPAAPPLGDGHDHIRQADGNVFDVLMLQVHVVSAAFWLISCVLVSLIAVPQLRRLPAPAFLHELQVRRELVLGVLWGTFALTLGTGTYLLFNQAAYDPPLSGSDFDDLRDQPYGLPYYYALYAKIAIFLVMGAASLILSMEANRAAQHSEAAGGPREDDGEFDSGWLDEEVLPEGAAPLSMASPVEGPDEVEAVEVGAGSTRTATRRAAPQTSVATLWSAVGVLAVGAGGVGFCVTLIKYFHELARAAVVYERLRGR
jgi:hypothetical protein